MFFFHFQTHCMMYEHHHCSCFAQITFSYCSCSIVFVMFLYDFRSFACNFLFWNFASNLFLQVCAFLVFCVHGFWVWDYNYYKFFLFCWFCCCKFLFLKWYVAFFSCFVSKLITIANVRVVNILCACIIIRLPPI